MADKALNFIGGKWSWPKGAKALVSLNPADRRDIVCEFPNTPAAEVDRAVQEALKAFPAWRHTPAPQRAKIIRRAGEILAGRKQQLGELVTRECGKPLVEGLGDVQEAIDMAELAAGEGRRLYGETTPSELPNKLCFTYREPVGVCGLDRALEFPGRDPGMEGASRADLREHDHFEAGGGNPGLRRRLRGGACGSRHSGRGRESGAWDCGRPPAMRWSRIAA